MMVVERKDRPAKEPSGRWLLLNTLRDILSGPGSLKAQLNEVLAEIAAFLEVEVCSFYVRKKSGKLVLSANTGLSIDQNEHHDITMLEGQGLVGFISETGELLNLSDAASHPSFNYVPGIGEELFRAFMGVPVLSEGRTLGVLTIQNRFEEHYAKDTEEILQTIAMMLGGLLTSESLRGGLDNTNEDKEAREVTRFSGDPLFRGIALGHVVLHEPRVSVTKLVSETPERELKLLEQALKRLTVRIDDLLAHGDLSSVGDHREVLESYRTFAHDRGWVRRLHGHIRNGATAEAAVGRVQNETRARFKKQTDPFFKDRLHDLDELSHRLLLELAGKTGTAADSDLPDNTILVARGMGPTSLLDYKREKLRGLILEEGGVSSHVAVVARALGIPAIGGVKHFVDAVDAGDSVIVDANEGVVHLRPSRNLQDAYQNKVRFHASRAEQYKKLRDVPAITKDGEAISLKVNLGLEINFPHVKASGAEGVGLFRTELEFMLSTDFPDLETQIDLYKQVYKSSDGMPVVFRTLDIGGDKLLPYMHNEAEENPAMGWRAIRMSLDRPEVFQTQIQALLQASAERDLHVLIPMVSVVEEFVKARQLVDAEFEANKKAGMPLPTSLKVGAMIEVPSILWQLDCLFKHTDFISLGTNDLMQFLFAADRANVRVAHRFNALSLAMLRVLRDIREKAEKAAQPVTVCGEMASTPLEALALLGLGYRDLSMAPASIGPVKEMILSTPLDELNLVIKAMLDEADTDIRTHLSEWAAEQGLEI